jgi:hypothetical protein
MLLQSIIRYVEDHKSSLHLPWTGLKLIIARDDASTKDLDYIERCIRIDCSDVSAQWIYSLGKIQNGNIFVMNDIKQKVEKAKELFETNALQTIVSVIRSIQDYQSAGEITLSVRKGFSCSEKKFAEFIMRMQSEYLNTIDSVEENDLISNTADLDHLPNNLKIVVEDSYGSRLLETGDIRLDCGLSANRVKQMLTDRATDFIDASRRYSHQREEIESLKKALVHRLSLKDLNRGIAVDDDKFLTFLRNTNQYLEQQNSNIHPLHWDTSKNLNRGAFADLEKLRVVVGHYSGIRDDGACLIPWNFHLNST